MSFEVKGISDNHFHHLNQFFKNGFDGNELLEQSQQIQHPLVDGYSSEWYFDGIRMGYSDWHYKKPVALAWNYDIDVELVTFQANLKGSVLMGKDSANAVPLFNNLQHNLFYAGTGDVNEGVLKGDRLASSMFFIQFTKNAFLRLAADGNDTLNRFNEHVQNGRSAVLTPHNLYVNANMLSLIKSIVHCKYKNNLKKMFLLSKAIELLVLQAEAGSEALNPSYKYIRSSYDRERIMYAREYIMSHLDVPPSLTELSRIVGINEYKLKRGFKEMFSNTVFGYLADARLELAKNDLLENRQSIAEIAFALGYSSLQHFSYAFKKKFGMSPSKLRR
ncbi:AraC family transcriptional regulator [Danxiaibacter flavus]|uniref:AraC family transcriptional regulator n=1 Tax=Danxiaibacter flavus TaxID=3049108 RepID=A0ABV3ZAC6_9BACT|nr:AraC family transcriptional regulator [Chitinophagaceae bacterium DXS]